MRDNVKIGLAIGLSIVMAFCYIAIVAIDTSSPSPLDWKSSVVPVLLLEGKFSNKIDCLNQYATARVGNEKIFSGSIQGLWNNEDNNVDVNRIPDGTKVAIYEKKFLWLHRHFIVCE
jgi:hypothetical protein